MFSFYLLCKLWGSFFFVPEHCCEFYEKNLLYIKLLSNNENIYLIFFINLSYHFLLLKNRRPKLKEQLIYRQVEEEIETKLNVFQKILFSFFSV